MNLPAASRRLIGRFDATMLVVGSMIGSGIFIVSAESARLVGTGGRLLGVWAAAGALTLLAAFACAELATMFPEAGGPYVFFREAYGPMAGFLYGWTMALVVQTGTIAAVAVAFLEVPRRPRPVRERVVGEGRRGGPSFSSSRRRTPAG